MLSYRLINCDYRVRKDLQVARSFLPKRAHHDKQNEGYCRKLRRFSHCICAKIDLEATIGIEDIGSLMTFGCACFAAYDSACGRTLSAIAFGIGVFMPESKTQSLNAKSSTECEIVAARGSLPKVARIHIFLEAQG